VSTWPWFLLRLNVSSECLIMFDKILPWSQDLEVDSQTDKFPQSFVHTIPKIMKKCNLVLIHFWNDQNGSFRRHKSLPKNPDSIKRR